MAARAPEAAMYGSRKLLPVHVQRNRFAGSHCAHALVPVAGEAFRPRLVGGASRAFEEQKGENCGEERGDDHSQASTPLPSHNFSFNHVELSAMLISFPDRSEPWDFLHPLLKPDGTRNSRW